MTKQAPSSVRGRYVSVTELAQLGICEQQLLLDKDHGKQRSKTLKNLASDGERIHAQYERALSQATDSRCFIASEIFGPHAPETNCLRKFRDDFLAPHWWGRMLCSLYYITSPGVVGLVRRLPALRSALHVVLMVFVNLLRAKVGENRND